MSQSQRGKIDLSQVDLQQSNAERVRIRAEYRKLDETVSAEAIVKADHLDKVEELFSDVRNTREAAIDSSLLRKFSEKYAKRVLADSKGSVPWKDVSTFRDILSSLVSASKWKAVGRLACKRMSHAPTPRFMLGPLGQDTTRKVRAQKKRKVWDSSQATQTLSKLDERTEKAQDFSAQRVRELYNILVEVDAAEEESGAERAGVCLFELCINPKSFAQSVENIFHLACLVKQQQAEIETDDDGLPRVFLADEQKKVGDDGFTRGEDDKPVEQGILNLTYREWREAIDTFGIKKCLVPHRAHHNEST